MLEKIIQEKIRPILGAHHGDIKLLGVKDGIADVRLIGACATCPGYQTTLTELIETEIEVGCSDIKRVRLIQDASQELIEEALKILRKNGR